MKLTFSTTQRGFAQIYFNDRYQQLCRLQKSSLAGEECIWLGVEENTNGEKVNELMHLTQEQAAMMANILSFFAQYGELPGTEVDGEKCQPMPGTLRAKLHDAKVVMAFAGGELARLAELLQKEATK